MNNDLLEKMLDLPEFQVNDLKHNDHDIEIYVSKVDKPNICTACGDCNPRLRIQQHRVQKVRDLNITNKLVALKITRTKYKCMECNSIFVQPLDSVPEGGRMTHRLRNYIAEQAKHRSFVNIKRELSISDVTIREIFIHEIHKLPQYYEFETPEVVSIDEIFIEREGKHRKQPWAVIFNQKEKTIIDMLPNRNKSTIVAFFKGFKNPENVKVVTTDMWETYKNATYESFPNAVVIIDKFHVVKVVNKALEDYRKSFKGALSNKRHKALKKDRFLLLSRPKKLGFTGKIFRDAILSEFPELRTAYNLKEQFYDIYEALTYEEAVKRYDKWIENIPDNFNVYDGVINTVNNWFVEIFNYFSHGRYTNAIAEGFNSVIRKKSYEGAGYDFEVFRAKIIYCINHKVDIHKYGAYDFKHALTSTYNFNLLDCYGEQENQDYGVPINSIIKFINEGKM